VNDIATHRQQVAVPAAATPTVDLFGVDLACLTLEESAQRVRELVASGGPHQHVVLNAAKVVAMEDDPQLRAIVRSCALVNADGTSIVWASRLLGRRLPERVAGIDLFDRLVAVAAADGHSIFLLGATDDVVKTTASVLEQRYPDVKIAGFRSGFWTDDDEVIAEVRAANPTYLFLAIPSPRKEYWLHEHLAHLGVPFVMGVGGSFDVVAGVTKRAPRAMQRVGLEWFWRFIQEPRRMWRRYLVGNARFIWLTIREKGRA
jgi:N-acetylglucosaminyldiphosphoundecaprenol N-acetyl-beta-D-mannosaminyltransferase